MIERFAGRTPLVSGALLATSVVARNTIDWWLSPTADFYARSVVSTWLGVALFTSAGLWTGWRTRSIRAGVLAGVATGAIAAAIVNVVSLGALAVWHDEHTMAMIKAGGGLEEVLIVPCVIILPGTCCASLGAAIAKAAVAVYSPSAKTNSA